MSIRVLTCDPVSAVVTGIHIDDDLDSSSLTMPQSCEAAAPGSATVSLAATTADGLPLTLSAETGATGVIELTAPVGTASTRAVITVRESGETVTGYVTLVPGRVIALIAVLPARSEDAAADSLAGSVAIDGAVPGWLLPGSLALILSIGGLVLVRRPGQISGRRRLMP